MLKFHLNEYHRNRITGKYSGKYLWVVSDLTYNDGILMAREEHHITVMIIHFPGEIANFIVTKKSNKRIKDKTKFEQLDSDRFDKLNAFLVENDSFYLESIDDEMLLYKKERLLSAKEIISMHDFANKICYLVSEISDSSSDGTKIF